MISNRERASAGGGGVVAEFFRDLQEPIFIYVVQWGGVG